MKQPTMMTYEEVRAALDAGKALHQDNDGNIIGIAGEMELPPFEPDIRDDAGWAEIRTEYDSFMKAGEYGMATEYANEWLLVSGDAAFWAPLVDAANKAWDEACQPEDLAPMRDDVDGDDMDWFRDLSDRFVVEHRNSRITIRSDSDSVFEEAIARGFLSHDPDSPIYAGDYMYMHHDWCETAHFKHCDTREYLTMPDPDFVVF